VVEVTRRYEAWVTEYQTGGGTSVDEDDDDNINDIETTLPRVYGAAVFPSGQDFSSPNLDYTLKFGYDKKWYVESHTEHFFNPWGYVDEFDQDADEKKYFRDYEMVFQVRKNKNKIIALIKDTV